MQLGDLGIEFRGEGWNLRGVAGSRRDHHVVGREGGIAGLDQIAGTVSGDRVDLDPASHWELKPLRIGGHVIADLVLGREREAGRWEGHFYVAADFNPCSYANAVAAARVDKPSLVKMLLTWRATVFSLMTSSVAIARLLLPLATRRRTCTSRADRPPISFGAAGCNSRSRLARSGAAPSRSNACRAALNSISAFSLSPRCRDASPIITLTRAAS